ncbi:VOC family protein [Nocardioides sp. NPDC092400]|uniref:VOC family protein n=1 Tax=Nocardioides sp. NPDC092400 TaxID=3155196 RepID=UPI003432C0F0
MSRMIFLNLPVADVQRARDFWTALGLTFDEQFSDGKAACLVLNEQCSAMLLQEEFFHSFHGTTSAGGTEVLVCLAAGSREEVDELCTRAAAAGATDADARTGEGPMYGGSFRDPDGHVWEVMHMDMSAMG